MKYFGVFFLLVVILSAKFKYRSYSKPHHRHSKHKKPSLFPVVNSVSSFRFKQTPQSIQLPETTKAIFGTNDDIGPGPIYKKGWLKYLTVTSKTSDSFSKFTKNSAFSEQNPATGFITLPNTNREMSDDCGPMEIPDQYHFFFYLTSDSMLIVSARKNSLAKTLRVLHFKKEKNAEQQVDHTDYLIGVEDQGNYQEGYCFKLRVENCGMSEFLILCADRFADKADWIKKISVLQLRCQNPEPHVVNQAIVEANIRENGHYETKYNENYQENILFKTPQKIDGRWITLQEWSTCTLACGGGTQTLHRMCIPPSDGGVPCQGSSIVNRSCNTQPCPNVRVVVDEKVAPTRVKMLRISKRPQRYEVYDFLITKILFYEDLCHKRRGFGGCQRESS